MDHGYGEAVMTLVRTSVEIAAPREEAWKVVADPRNLPKWDRHIVSVTGVPDSGLEDGTEYTTQVEFGPITSRVDAHVEEIRPPEYSRIRLTGLLDAVVATKLLPVDGGKRCRLEQEVDFAFKGGPIGRAAAKALQITGGPAVVLRRGVLAQKRQVERAYRASR
jgi:carbon monoxide dehydrogenase subunit G